MSAKTKIIVLRMKELIYTGIFIALGLLLIILLIVFFTEKERRSRFSHTGAYLCTRYLYNLPDAQ